MSRPEKDQQIKLLSLAESITIIGGVAPPLIEISYQAELKNLQVDADVVSHELGHLELFRPMSKQPPASD